MGDAEKQGGAAAGTAASGDGDPEFARMMKEELGFDAMASVGDPDDKGNPPNAEPKDGNPEEGDPEGEEPGKDDPKDGKPGEGDPEGEEPGKDDPKDGKPDGEDDPEDDASGRGKLSPEAQAAVDRRIGKEVARRKDLEDLLEGERTLVRELKARLKETEESARPESVSALALAESEDDLRSREDYLWRVVEFCEEHPDGYEGNGSDEDPPYTAEELRKRLRSARRELQRDLPRARDLLSARREKDAAAREVYPDLERSDSDLSIEVRNLERRFPALKADPDSRLLLADLAAGRMARLDRAKNVQAPPAEPKPKPDASPEPKPRKPRAPAAPGAPSGPSADPGAKGSRRNAYDKFASGGFSDEALEESFIE